MKPQEEERREREDRRARVLVGSSFLFTRVFANFKVASTREKMHRAL